MKLQEHKKTLLRYAALTTYTARCVLTILFQRLALESSNFSQSVCLMVSAFVRLFTCMILVFVDEKSVWVGLKKIWRELFVNRWCTIQICVVATAYAASNVLRFVALENLKNSTFMVAQQTKIVCTAVFAVLILKKRISWVQWTAIMVLLAGILINKSDKLLQSKTEKADVDENLVIGLLLTLASCAVSAFGGVWHEKVFKDDSLDSSQELRNTTLSLAGAVFTVFYAVAKDGPLLIKDGFSPMKIVENGMQGFTWQVWAFILVFAYDGLVHSFTLVHAGNILMCFANSVAVIMMCLLDWWLFEYTPTLLFAAGSAVTIVAAVMYSVNPHSCRSSGRDRVLPLNAVSVVGVGKPARKPLDSETASVASSH